MKKWIVKYKKRIIFGSVSAVACMALCMLWCIMAVSKVQDVGESTEQMPVTEEIHSETQEQLQPQESVPLESETQEAPETQEIEANEIIETPVQENSVAIASEKENSAAQKTESEIDRSGGVAKSIEVNRSGSTLKETGNISYLGTFRTTAYCACVSCSEGWGNQTATGVPARPNRTIAVDPKVIKLGSRVVIDGKEYVAEDTGGAIKGNKIDIYFANHAEAMKFGVRSKEVYLAK